jgi:hypothetical protein
MITIIVGVGIVNLVFGLSLEIEMEMLRAKVNWRSTCSWESPKLFDIEEAHVTHSVL